VTSTHKCLAYVLHPHLIHTSPMPNVRLIPKVPSSERWRAERKQRETTTCLPTLVPSTRDMRALRAAKLTSTYWKAKELRSDTTYCVHAV
jgi:hypothetical protein